MIVITIKKKITAIVSFPMIVPNKIERKMSHTYILYKQLHWSLDTSIRTDITKYQLP